MFVCASNEGSRKSVAAIDERVTACLIRRGITGEVEEETLDLLDVTLSAKRRHAVCLVDDTRASTQLCLEESWTDNVDSSKFPPLPRERLAHMGDGSLGRVVDGLIDGDVDDVGRHARGDDEVALALTFEDLAYVLGAVEDAVDVDLHLTSVLLDGLFEDGLGDGHAGIGNKDVDTTKVSNDLVDGSANLVHPGDLALVGLCSDRMSLCELFSLVDGNVIGVVPECNVCACFGDSLDGSISETFTSTGHDDHLALHAELLEDIGGRVGHWAGLSSSRAVFDGHRHVGEGEFGVA